MQLGSTLEVLDLVLLLPVLGAGHPHGPRSVTPDPLSNPYRVPGREFSLDFYERRGPLNRTEVTQLFHHSADLLRHTIHKHGDKVLPEPWIQGSDEVAFGVGAIDGPQPLLTYTAVRDILVAVRMKVQEEGCFGWFGEIFVEEPRDYIGLFILGEKFAKRRSH